MCRQCIEVCRIWESRSARLGCKRQGRERSMGSIGAGSHDRAVARIGRFGRFSRILSVALLLATVSASLIGFHQTEAKVPSKYYVSSTGHSFGEPFLSSWIAQDGMTTLGMPVTESHKANKRITQ